MGREKGKRRRLGRWCTGWSVPCGREAPEVIQPNRIHAYELGTLSINRPPITGRAYGVPVVDGIPHHRPCALK